MGGPALGRVGPQACPCLASCRCTHTKPRAPTPSLPTLPHTYPTDLPKYAHPFPHTYQHTGPPLPQAYRLVKNSIINVELPGVDVEEEAFEDREEIERIVSHSCSHAGAMLGRAGHAIPVPYH